MVEDQDKDMDIEPEEKSSDSNNIGIGIIKFFIYLIILYGILWTIVEYIIPMF